MAFSKLYNTLLSKKFFVDLRQVDSLSMLLTKYLEHDVTDFTANIYSEEHPLGVSMVDAMPQMLGGQASGGEAKKIAIVPSMVP